MSVHLKEKWLLYQLKTKQDPEAYGKLYDFYAPRIYRFIYFKVSSSLDAEDLTAEVFLKAWEYLKKNQEKGVEKFGGLLYKIARNLVVDFYRKKPIKETSSIEEFYLEKISDAGVAAEKMEKADEVRGMIKHLKLLKEDYREVLTLRYIDGLDAGEIAGILGKSSINVRVLTHRALKTLRKILENQNV